MSYKKFDLFHQNVRMKLTQKKKKFELFTIILN